MFDDGTRGLLVDDFFSERVWLGFCWGCWGERLVGESGRGWVGWVVHFEESEWVGGLGRGLEINSFPFEMEMFGVGMGMVLERG